MRKTISTLLILALTLSLCLALVGCGGKSEGRTDAIYGTWEGEWDYNGAHITCVMTVKDDGTYERSHTRDGIPSGTDKGDFEFADNVLITYKDVEHSVMIQYEYIDGQLTNGGHFLNKR